MYEFPEIIPILLDWRSMYFIELFWIAQTYSLVALIVTYLTYLIVDMRLNGVQENLDPTAVTPKLA